MAGVLRDADGTLDAGADLRGVASQSGTLDTNDPDFARRFYRGSNAVQEPAPDPGPDSPASERDLKVFLLPGAIVAAGAIIGLFGFIRHRAG